MASFGESLRQERLRKQITLDQVTESTKINQRYLQAIEEEKLQELPGGVFNRNFVRNYARYLGLDEEQYVEEYIRATGDSAQTSALPNPPAGREEPLISLSTLLAVLIAGIVVLVIWAGYHLYQEQELSKPVEATANTPPTSQTASRQLIAPPVTNGAGQSPNPSTPGNSSSKLPSPANAALAAQPKAVTVPAPALPPPGNATGSPSESAALPPTPPGQSALVVSATIEPAWISVYTDGHWRLETTLKAGERKEVFFRKNVHVTSGDAGATAISINGKSVGTLGKIGMVAHFAWPPESAGDGTAQPPAAGATHPNPGTAVQGGTDSGASSTPDTAPPPRK